MSRRELDERILHELWRVHGISSKYAAFRLRAFMGVPLPQFLVMRALASSDYMMAVTDIASALGCARGNVTPIVDRLVEFDWVTKTRSPRDARVFSIWATPVGIEQYERLAEEVAGVADALFDPLYPEEKEQLLALLEKVTGLTLD
jgi:DNA-binding MarR family transcriptional regulator